MNLARDCTKKISQQLEVSGSAILDKLFENIIL